MTALDPSARTSASPAAGDAEARRAAYLALTKPRIIELLLVTTVPVMFLAHKGIPSLWLVVATLVGGTLSAGAANTFNCVYDRDIDADHAPHEQPADGHRRDHARARALVFGVVLTVASTVWFAAVRQLAVGGAVARRDRHVRRRLHVLLKRRTAQNIVWGGAAGCMPVAHRLVGGHRTPCRGRP